MNDGLNRERELRELASRLGLDMHNVTLYDRALTHASITGETGDSADANFDYESLEFLGDAVLGLAVAHDLFSRHPDRTPGDYSRMRAAIVNRRIVARVGLRLNIVPVIRLGKGEERSGGRERTALIADCMEALIGAIYLDHGWETACRFVVEAFAHELNEVENQGRIWDYKSRLQHYCQAERMTLPVFNVVRSDGPDHRKEFEIEVVMGEEPAGRGIGHSKKEAEQQAARATLEGLGIHLG